MQPIGIHVLIVGNNPRFLRRVTQVLQRFDEVDIVSVATSFERVQGQLAALQPQIILLDLTIPDLSSLRAISRARETLPQVGIIALTSLGIDDHQRAMLSAGLDDFVTKATISTDLHPVIQRVWHQGQTLQK